MEKNARRGLNENGPPSHSGTALRAQPTVVVFLGAIILFNVIDVVTTIQLMEGAEFTAGQLVKGAVFVLVAILNLRYVGRNKGIIFFYLLFYYFLLVEVANLAVYQYSLQFFLRGLSFCMKALLPFMLYYYFVALYHKGRIDYVTLRRGLYLYLVLFSLNIIVPVLAGVSHSTYGSSGYKGFYYAQNEIGAFVTVSFPVLIYFYLRETRRRFSLGLLIVLLIVSGVLTGSKTPLISIVLSLAMVPLLLSNRRDVWLFLSPALAVGAASLMVWFGRDLLDVLPRNIYGRLLWTISKRSDVLDILLGVRIDYFLDYMAEIRSKGFFGILFGNGFVYSTQFMYQHLGVYKTAEMDGVDLLARYGVVGMVLVLMMIIMIFRSAYDKRSGLSIIVAYMFALLIVNATLAGHVFGNAFSAMILGIIFAMNTIKKEQLPFDGHVGKEAA